MCSIDIALKIGKELPSSHTVLDKIDSVLHFAPTEPLVKHV